MSRKAPQPTTVHPGYPDRVGFLLPIAFEGVLDAPKNIHAFDAMCEAVHELTEPDEASRLSNSDLAHFSLSLLCGYVKHPWLVGGVDLGLYGISKHGKYISFLDPDSIANRWTSLDPNVSERYQAAASRVIAASEPR